MRRSTKPPAQSQAPCQRVYRPYGSKLSWRPPLGFLAPSDDADVSGLTDAPRRHLDCCSIGSTSRNTFLLGRHLPLAPCQQSHTEATATANQDTTDPHQLARRSPARIQAHHSPGPPLSWRPPLGFLAPSDDADVSGLTDAPRRHLDCCSIGSTSRNTFLLGRHLPLAPCQQSHTGRPLPRIRTRRIPTSWPDAAPHGSRPAAGHRFRFNRTRAARHSCMSCGKPKSPSCIKSARTASFPHSDHQIALETNQHHEKKAPEGK